MFEEFKVLTVHDVDFTDERGKQVIGIQLWLIHENTTDPEWNGYEVLKVWVPETHSCYDVVCDLQHDDLIRIQWNCKGKATVIEPV